MIEETTKKCPFCAEEIKVAAIVCKHCGRDLQENGGITKKITTPILKILLHPVFIILVAMYVSTQFGIRLSGIGLALFCGFWIVLIVVTSQIRDKLLTDKERKSEKEDAEYWEQHGR